MSDNKLVAWPPHIVFYAEDLPPQFIGTSKMCVVKIRPKYRADEGTHRHEATHVMQWYTTLLLGVIACLALLRTPALAPWAQYWPAVLAAGLAADPLAYGFIKSYRLWAEVQAYRVQARYYPDDRAPAFAKFLSTNYGLDITPADALARLRGA